MVWAGGAAKESRGRRNRRTIETFVDLGSVDAPSGVLVLGMAGWIDRCREPGQSLFDRARAVSSSGGGIFVRGWERRSRSRPPTNGR